MEPLVLFLYLLLGALAGVLAGLLGVGGGLIIVPALAMIFTAWDIGAGMVMQIAVATSLATIVATSIASTITHHRHAAVAWPSFWRLSPGIVIGSLLGALVADTLPSDTLKIVFAGFELLVAAQMLFDLRPTRHWPLPGAVGLSVAGIGIGGVSAVVGIGGGTLTVPFLSACGVQLRRAIATSAACGLPIALAASVGFIITGWQQPGLPVWSLGYVYLPGFIAIIVTSVIFAPLGAKLTHRLPVPLVKKLFAIFLLLVGLRLLVS